MTPAVTVWFDPGKVTGVAIWYHDRKFFHSTQGEFWPIGVWFELFGIQKPDLHPDGPIEVGWERYIVTPGNSTHGTADYSLETIGMIRWLALKYEMEILKPQVSSQMAIATDERLKAIGWYKPGKGHANDAARHLLRYFIASKTLPEELSGKLFGGVSEGH